MNGVAPAGPEPGFAAGDGGAAEAAGGADGADDGALGSGAEGGAGALGAGRAAGPPFPEDHVGVAEMSGAALGALDAGPEVAGAEAAGAAGAGAAAGGGVGDVTAGGGGAGDAPALGAGDADPGRVSMWPRMSCLVTRPAIPVPGIWRMSTLCSAAILRTTGEERVWRNSSGVMSARGFSGAGAAAGVGAGAAEG